MSTDRNISSGKTVLEDLAAETKRLVDEATAEELEAQDDLFDPITAEEAAEAHDELGINASPLTVLRRVREKRKVGRPKGVRNKRSQDMVAYLSQFGPDPAVALMRIIAEPEEAMVARSKQVDPVKRQMTMGEAKAMRIRAAETMMPYFHGKQPVQVDARIVGVRMIQQIGELRDPAALLEGQIRGVMPFDDEEEN